MSLHPVLLTVIVTALVLATSSGSASRKSSQDQYEQRNDQAQTETNGHKPLIHRVQLKSTGVHRLNLLPSAENQEKSEKKDLQVGCAEGSVNVQQTKNVEATTVPQKRQKRDTENESDTKIVRQKRDFIHWLKPSNNYGFSQQIQHGYPEIIPQPTWNYQTPLSNYRIYLPIWGNPRTIPVFFPPRVILYNPGYPQHNRPSIVNPVKPDFPIDNTVASTESSIGSLPNRFGDPNKEEGVAWGFVESEEETNVGSPVQRPTQRPSRPGGTNIDRDPNDLQNIGTTTTRRPPTTRPPTTTTTTTAAPGAQLPRCIWAIISCCNPSNEQIRYSCFENLGCPGAFWDRSPCSKEVTQAAFDAAQKFYDQYDQS